ncbi:MAG TPA: hypothetical protein VE155_03200, partial [Pseudonocardiaceae bacterium]|nr:hypothetical protein [Pseudonocardiaceae bacterium]
MSLDQADQGSADPLPPGFPARSPAAAQSSAWREQTAQSSAWREQTAQSSAWREQTGQSSALRELRS